MPAYGLGSWGLGEYGVGEQVPDPSYVHPHDSGHQVLPEILLTIPDSTWPRSAGLPIGTGRCDSLRLDREIVASSLPGQVRGKSGFSIGDASVTVGQPARQFVPWSPSADRLIAAGDEAELWAWNERADTRAPLGRWRVSKPAGSLASSQVAVELDESQARGRSPNRLPTVAGPVDPAWIVDQLARQMGYFSTPGPTSPGAYTIPLCGGLAAHIGALAVDPRAGSTNPTWSMETGVPGLSGADVLPTWDVLMPLPLSIAANVSGSVVFRLHTYAPVLDVEVSAGGTFRARQIGGAWSSPQAFAAGIDPNWPMRVQLIVTASGSEYSIRARSSETSALSSAVTVPQSGEDRSPMFALGIQSMTGSISGININRADDTGVFAPASARMSLLDGTVAAPWVPASGDTWTSIQSVTDSWGAIAWVTNSDRLQLLNRHQAAGAGRPKSRIDVDRLAEDIRWSVAADDFADRLEVTWRPVTWPDEFTDPSEWTVAERLHVPAGGSVSVDVDLGGYVQWLAPFEPFATAGVGASEWQASTAPVDGDPVESGISVAVDHPTPSRARVKVTNMTASGVWMVDVDGGSGLFLRGTGLATQDEQSLVTRGAAEVDAKFPLSIDLGYTVQNRADAEALTSYLWERVNRPRWRSDSVRLPLDWSRDLGDLLLLDHPRSGLLVNALVTGIHIDTSSAGMTVDLVALPPTWSDFDAAWAGKTGANFLTAWAGKSGVAFDADPLNTEA